jgi:hypothetical protein
MAAPRSKDLAELLRGWGSLSLLSDRRHGGGETMLLPQVLLLSIRIRVAGGVWEK